VLGAVVWQRVYERLASQTILQLHIHTKNHNKNKEICFSHYCSGEWRVKNHGINWHCKFRKRSDDLTMWGRYGSLLHVQNGSCPSWTLRKCHPPSTRRGSPIPTMYVANYFRLAYVQQSLLGKFFVCTFIASNFCLNSFLFRTWKRIDLRFFFSIGLEKNEKLEFLSLAFR